MPSKKILSVLIICLGVVVSIWLFARDGSAKISTKNTIANISDISDNSSTATNILNDQGDWQKILVSVDQGTTTDLTSQSSSAGSDYPNEGTVTDQMAKDFFAQYLIAKQGGAQVTTDQAAQIAQNTLSSSQYTKATGAVYTANNLHISPQTSKEVVLKYMNDGNQILTNHSNQKYQNELTILNVAIKSGKESDLAKLDPIIANYKGMISDSINISVPSDAVDLHLAMLNAISNVLSNVEAMRVTFSDPVRSFAGVSQYKQHVLDIGVAISKLGEYFKAKGVIPSN